jgi:hypothetical protein
MKLIQTLIRKIWFLPVMVALASCERDFDVELEDGTPLLVVEAYINNILPQNNYVVLTRSQDFYSPDYRSLAVSKATVSITEGDLSADGESYIWNPSSKVVMLESNNRQVPDSLRQGVYFDPRLFTNATTALRGRTGKHYLLEIEVGGKHYSAVTGLLQPVGLDSVSTGPHFTDSVDGRLRARITANYQDPDTIGNTQMYYWRSTSNRNNFGWSGMSRNRRARGEDDLTNGEYMRITQNQSVAVGDSVEYFLSSVERKVFNFWKSYDKARQNDGPFSTPVALDNTVTGENVVGCFSGFSISTRKIKIK